MRFIAAAVFALVFTSPTLALATGFCGSDPGDAAAVTDTRAAIAFSCDCAGATSHGEYVHCAAAVISLRVGAMLLPARCKGDVRRCASRSTCGRPGAVTCCRTKSNGARQCLVKRNPAACVPPLGGTACVASAVSCCDACGPSGCITTTTTTTSTTTTSSTVPDPCGGTWPACNGSCPPGMECHPEEVFPPNFCGCFPTGVTPCSSSTFPECGGTCSVGVCAPVAVYLINIGTIEYCTCLDPASNCSGSFQNAMCPGVCAAGSVCYGEPDPGGLGFCVGCIPDCFPFCTP